ncbi:MAG: ECF transporter S component [Lachnospiraceae bacterium]|nr:ECF transporter S component [Candidatus Darwinimomas equi]
MEQGNSRKKIIRITQAALVAALSFVVFEFIRIPVSETTSIHLGNAFVVLGALLLGPLWGGLAGAVGLTLADLLAGLALSAPKTFILKFIMGLAAGLVSEKCLHIREAGQKSQLKIALISSAVALGLNVILDPVVGYFYKMYILGQPQELAATLAKISSIATLINAAACAAVVTLLWPLLFRALRKANLLTW